MAKRLRSKRTHSCYGARRENDNNNGINGTSSFEEYHHVEGMVDDRLGADMGYTRMCSGDPRNLQRRVWSTLGRPPGLSRINF